MIRLLIISLFFIFNFSYADIIDFGEKAKFIKSNIDTVFNIISFNASEFDQTRTCENLVAFNRSFHNAFDSEFSNSISCINRSKCDELGIEDSTHTNIHDLDEELKILKNIADNEYFYRSKVKEIYQQVESSLNELKNNVRNIHLRQHTSRWYHDNCLD